MLPFLGEEVHGFFHEVADVLLGFGGGDVCHEHFVVAEGEMGLR